ncbi:MAG: hypothetical protein K2X29_10895, partial [Candidatus Obscuribacterales bacterium]|nr:hypothetical protein [Candidatus Obscuribacterales bacterium]
EILSKAKKKISVEVNFTSQLARYIRSETGIAMDGHVNRYDGEPMEPEFVCDHVQRILAGKPLDLDVTEAEAREMGYHYLRTHYAEKMRPGKITRGTSKGISEDVWNIELVDRTTGEKQAEMVIGISTGATYSYKSLVAATK